jgi:hypothetical protein
LLAGSGSWSGWTFSICVRRVSSRWVISTPPDATPRDAQLARKAKSAALKAQALNRQALVEMRRGNVKAALASATAAPSARQSKRSPLIAMSLFRHAEAQYREKPSPQGLKNAMEAQSCFASFLAIPPVRAAHSDTRDVSRSPGSSRGREQGGE